MKHVDRYLTDFTNEVLGPEQSTQIREHLAICYQCRERHSEHLRIAHDLRIAIGYNPSPKTEQIRTWWSAIATAPSDQLRARLSPYPRYAWAVMPVLAAVSMLLPLTVGLLRLSPVSANSNEVEASVLLNVTNLAPAETRMAILTTKDQTLSSLGSSLSTEAPVWKDVPVSAATAIPAPLAP